jgi:2-dehydro-3-deoxyphosphogluconate aldolase/(4S)-4-hydroxy-2-oxoglutarate aldolase
MTSMSEKMAVLDRTLHAGPVIAVLVVDDVEQAVLLSRALVAGGVRVLEFTLRTATALEAVRRVVDEVPGAIVGTGTVRTPEQLDASARAGAAFAVSPGGSPKLLDAAADHPLPLLPGAVTASEVMALHERGYTHQKFFPAVAAGGPSVLKAFASPLAGITFCPTGGIKASTARDWLDLPNVACVGGSWVAPKDALAVGDWARIRSIAAAAAAL